MPGWFLANSGQPPVRGTGGARYSPTPTRSRLGHGSPHRALKQGTVVFWLFVAELQALQAGRQDLLVVNIY